MKYNILYIALAAGVLLTSSCTDFLTEAPKLSQSDELTLSNYNGLNLSTAGIYSPLASSNWYGQGFILINELKTSNGKKLIGTLYDSNRCVSHYQVSWNENNTSGLWGTAYYTIVNASEIIDHLGNAESEANVSEQDIKNLEAECRFIRALAHFDLVRTYAQPYCYTADASHLGVPVVLHKDPSGNPARNTVKEVYDAVIEDLLAAESLIDPEYRRSGAIDETATVTVYAIQALLARVYLYSEQWQQAADYATKVIDSKEFKLWNSESFAKIGKDGAIPYTKGSHSIDGKDEVIFEVFDDVTNDYNLSLESLANLCAPNAYGDAGATDQLINLFEDADARKKLFVDDSFGQKEADGVHWSAKYLGKDESTPAVNNTIVLRLSEMHLIRAEAVALHGATSKVSAVDDLKAIAERMGATAQNATASGIALERIKEFNWEGHLWFDLGRTKQNMTRTDETKTGVIASIEWGSKYFAMPIPYSQIKVSNGVLVQNEGY